MDIPEGHRHQIIEGDAPVWAVQNTPGALPSGPTDGADYPALLNDAQHNLETNTIYQRHVRYLPNQASVQHGSRIEVEFSPEVEQLIVHTVQIRRGDEVLDLRPGQTLRVLHRETHMERFVFNGRLLAVLVLNDIRSGDIIDWSYSLQAIQPPLFGRVAGRFLLRGTFAAKALRYRLVYRPDRPLYARVHNGECESQTAYISDDLIECTWELNDVKVIEVDPKTPVWALPFQWIDYGEFGTWDEVAEAAAPLFFDETESLPPYLLDWLEQMRQNSPSPEDFVLQIIRYVQDRIRYVAVSIDEHTCKPYPLSTILERNYGDCKDKAMLLCRLLRQAGFDALPALVHAQMREFASEGLPRPGAFNHAIARLQHGDHVQWIDPTLTDQGGRLGHIPHPPYGVALVLGSDEPALEAVPSEASRHQISYDEFAKVHQHDGTAELRVTRKFSGAAADGIRHQIAAQGLAEMDRVLVNDYLQIYPEVTVLFPATSDDHRDENQVTIVHTYMLARIWSRISRSRRLNQAHFPVFGIRPLLHLPPSAHRTFPYPVAHPLQVHASLEIRMPAGFRLTRDQIVINSPAFHCKCLKKTSSNSALVSVEYKSTRDHILVKELPPHEEAISQLAQFASFSVTAPEQVVQRGWARQARR
jgi:hypothetical protein